ncbi:MAG: ribosome recycling factor [Candidatus Gracilibacteria bacterium]|nr:ribosome recycling factor [Candidatus Gracilibacteria bacterium]
MSVQDALSKAQAEFEKSVSHLKDEFNRLQVGRANPALIENVPVEMYGASQPIKAVASISIPDPRTIQIQPWDKSALAAIEKGIVGVGLNLNPINDGVCVRINIPPLTEERRKDLVKVVYKLAEDAKIVVRTARQDANAHFKQLKSSSEITEDDQASAEKQLQAKVDEFNKKLEDLAKEKEKEVMTV